MIYLLIIIIIALIGMLMMGVILLQSGKGGGLAGIASGGGGATQILGTRQAPGVLEKLTWSLAAAFIVLCILSNFFVGGPTTEESILQQQSQELPVQAPVTPPVPTPDGGN